LGAILEAFSKQLLQFGFAFANDNLGPKQDPIDENADRDPSSQDIGGEAMDEPSP
jgi:hypothetical protein